MWNLVFVHSVNSYALCLLTHSSPGVQTNNLAWVEYTEKDTVCKPLDPHPEYSIGQICNNFLTLVIRIAIDPFF